MSEWIKATLGSLPGLDYSVIGMIDGRPIQVALRLRNEGTTRYYYWAIELPDYVRRECAFEGYATCSFEKVTHWMPLPDGPAESEDCNA